MPLPTLLDKPYGYKRSQGQLARNRAAAALLEAGELRSGDLYLAVAGVEPVPVSEVNPVSISGSRTSCIDCRRELEWAGKQLKSQPRRCLPCGQFKRRAHNQQTRANSEIPAEADEAPTKAQLVNAVATDENVIDTPSGNPTLDGDTLTALAG